MCACVCEQICRQKDFCRQDLKSGTSVLESSEVGPHSQKFETDPKCDLPNISGGIAGKSRTLVFIGHNEM